MTRHPNELRAGLFVLAGVLVLTAAIFFLGQKSALFSRTTRLYVEFNDISGLAVGAPVRLSGLEVGSVDSIAFSDDPRDRRTRVRLVVQTRYMPRIRKDSLALIDSAGLLGDKVVNISMGSPDAPALSDGATLASGQALSFEALSTGLNQAVTSLTRIAGKVEGIVGSPETSKLQRDVGRVAASIAGIMEQVERGDGLAHQLIYDPGYGRDVSATLHDLRSTAESARRAMARVDGVLATVERGDGTLHALIYERDGKEALAALASAAKEIAALVRAVEERDGVLHALVYEPESRQFVTDMNRVAATLRRITDDIDKGRGSLGGLVRDPTVYEDLKSVLGNVKRNVLFKALIRFTVEQDGLRRAQDRPSVGTDDSSAIPTDGSSQGARPEPASPRR